MTYENELAAACALIGMRTPEWIQATGGNISVKSLDHLWIKASGVRLRDVTAEAGWVKLALRSLEQRLEELQSGGSDKEYAQALRECVDKRSVLRPSMETAMHAWLPSKWVLHFHSLAGILMGAHFRKNPSLMKDYFGAIAKEIAIIPYVDPGFALAEKARDAEKFPILLLEKHGVILHGADPMGPDGLLEQWMKLELEFCKRLELDYLMDALTETDHRLKLRKMRQIPAGPWRIYFPDAAVFSKQVLANLREEEPGSGCYKYVTTSEATDGTEEIWNATQLLNISSENLREITKEAEIRLSQMETEKHRRKIAK